MEKCVYRLANGLKYWGSYTELLNDIDQRIGKNGFALDSYSDMVYSLNSKLEYNSKALKEANIHIDDDFKKDTYTITNADINGEQARKGEKSTMEVIENATINGQKIVTSFDGSNRKAIILQYVNERVTDGDIRSEVEDRLEAMSKQWEPIANDFANIAKAINDKSMWEETSTGLYRFYDEHILPTEKDKEHVRLTNSALDLMKTMLRDFRHSEHDLRHPDGSEWFNLNFTAPMIGTGEKVNAHIDYAILDTSGTLHCYLFKTSVVDPKEWLLFKEDRYRWQLAFIKQIVESNGVNVKNMRMSVVPLHVKYNADYTLVLSINVFYGEGIRRYSLDANGFNALHKYEIDARLFINTGAPRFHYTTTNRKRADEIISAIFPDLNIVLHGIAESARLLVAEAPDTPDADGNTPLVITHVGDVGHTYDVIINGKTHRISNKKTPTRNPEILALVNKEIADILKNMDYPTTDIYEALKASIANGRSMFMDKDRRFRSSAANIEEVFKEYIPDIDKETKKPVEKWKMLDSLLDYNILLFHNEDTQTIDVVSLTPYNINALIRFRKGDNLLGSYLTSLQYNSLKGNYGNVEAVRVMTLLNEVIGELDHIKLGTLKVMSAIGNSDYISYDIGEFNRRYYNEIILHIQALLPGLGHITNNFHNAEFVDPCVALFKTYQRLINGRSKFLSKEEYEKQYTRYGFDFFDPEKANNEYHEKLDALVNILRNILADYERFNDPLEVLKAMADLDHRLKHDMAVLYEMTTRTYLTLTGLSPTRETDWDVIRGYMMTPFSLADDNVRYVVDNLLLTYDKVADDFSSEFDKHMRNVFRDYYKSVGYTSLENMTIGSLARVYRNLIDPNSKYISFKNPYDRSNNLTNNERTLLKKILHEMEYIRSGHQFNISAENTTEMQGYIRTHPEYLWVPLERASRATRRSSATAMKKHLRNLFRRIWNIAERYLEQVLGVTREEMELVNNNSEDFYALRLRNKFDTNMPTGGDIRIALKNRMRMINKYGKEFFETNLENIAIDYLFSDISTRHLNRYLVLTRAMLLLLAISGDHAGNKESVKKEIDYILKYLKSNVYHVPIVSKKEQGIISLLLPLRRFATAMLIGGNLVGMMRDTWTGMQQSMVRSLIKLNTDIDPASVVKAHAYVTKNATSNAMAINLLSKLCLKYRLAGSDIARLPERAKTGRNGLFNFENWMYGTMRTPDFMNRMVLFVARCMHDGTLDAFSIDAENNLVYDWKKDKRFSAYANGRTSDPHYNELKALYFSKVREYNIEHPDSPIDMTAALPTPYSDAEIRNIQALGDNIYGAYDRSKRAMIENTSVGWAFTMFFTWMGGITNNYFALPHRGVMGKLVAEQEIDEHGRPLFFNYDGTITTNDTGLKVYKNIPVIVQGVWPTICDAVRLCANDGFGGFLNYIRQTPLARATMNKVISDVLMSALLAMLFGFAFNDAYKEYKEEDMIDNPLLLNIAFEAIYKGAARACDLFKGPFVLYKYFFDNLNSPLVSVPVRTVNDTLNWMTGNKSTIKFFSSLSGFIRPILDSVRAEWHRYDE